MGCRPVQAKTFAALDVHVRGSVATIIDRDSGELRRRRLSGSASEVTDFVAALPGPVRATYEAGPTGFALLAEPAGLRGDGISWSPVFIERGISEGILARRESR